MDTLSWSIFEPNLESAAPSAVPMGGSRGVLIGYDPKTARMFLRIPAERNSKPPSGLFAELEVAITEEGANTFIEVSTNSRHLYRELHRFAGLLTEDLETQGQSANGAFLKAIARWQEFSAIRSSLTPDQQIGLFGELILLEALIRVNGPRAIEAWTAWADAGPSRHDFEMDKVDLEIKSTRGRTRVHVIHGLTQLTPASNRPLYVLSFRFEPSGAGPGQTLSGQVHVLTNLLANDVHSIERLRVGLESSGYRSSDEALYGASLRLADRPRLIEVDPRFPRIDADGLTLAIGADKVALISDVSYRVNVEGLGTTEGTAEFDRVLNGARPQL